MVGKVLQFPTPPKRLRTDVDPFDPNNPGHIAAWEAMWDFAMRERRRREEKDG
jgi:hypothetical protein